MGGRGAFLRPRAARKHDDQKLTLCRTRGVHLPQPLLEAVEEESHNAWRPAPRPVNKTGFSSRQFQSKSKL